MLASLALCLIHCYPLLDNRIIIWRGERGGGRGIVVGNYGLISNFVINANYILYSLTSFYQDAITWTAEFFIYSRIYQLWCFTFLGNGRFARIPKQNKYCKIKLIYEIPSIDIIIDSSKEIHTFVVVYGHCHPKSLKQIKDLWDTLSM